jgi:hypothetical protein
MPTKLIDNVLSVVLPSHQARKLTRIAEDKGVNVSQLVNEVLGPLLAGEESDTRYVLIHIDEAAYQAYVEFFEGDMRFVFQSMGAHVESGGDDFAKAIEWAERNPGPGWDG